MIQVLAWPFVAFCGLAVLWRGVDMVVMTMRARTNSHAISIRDHEKALSACTTKIAEHINQIQKLEDDLLNLSQRVP